MLDWCWIGQLDARFLKTLMLCLGGSIKYRIELILGLIIYFIFSKLHFRLDNATKFDFSPKIMGLAIPIKTWV